MTMEVCHGGGIPDAVCDVMYWGLNTFGLDIYVMFADQKRKKKMLFIVLLLVLLLTVPILHVLIPNLGMPKEDFVSNTWLEWGTDGLEISFYVTCIELSLQFSCFLLGVHIVGGISNPLLNISSGSSHELVNINCTSEVLCEQIIWALCNSHCIMSWSLVQLP